MYIQVVALLSPILRPQAYLDPGSGSFLVQLLIAAVVGAGFLIKAYWKKIKSLFTRSGSKKENGKESGQ
ncbi:MAG: hypothetical protein A2136_11420 [Chloroflexi bacterium RBG_16_54_11]|nr:MAG: hypothetical protein A2136_11420 [Chloroflexi bacterium RBG_16_54_11]